MTSDGPASEIAMAEVGLECPICGHQMPRKRTRWTHYCQGCDYWGSTLAPVTDVKVDAFLDEARDKENPIAYLDALRSRNFATVIEMIRSHASSSRGALLEVGCGPGMFLAKAEAAGFRATGLEPYEAMARLGMRQGLDIRVGLFPTCIPDDTLFDAIVFNDVLEHLPSINAALTTCLKHLNPDGLLVINIPNSRGLFFRLAYAATFVGVWTPWERMWQKCFFTPHLHYVSPESLDLLCTRAGFKSLGKPIRLRATDQRGLWTRIRASRELPILVAGLLYCGASCLTAVARLLPSDCMLSLYRKPAGTLRT